jgi:hypothetical protein
VIREAELVGFALLLAAILSGGTDDAAVTAPDTA